MNQPASCEHVELRGSECAFPECECPGDEPVCSDYKTPAEIYGLRRPNDG